NLGQRKSLRQEGLSIASSRMREDDPRMPAFSHGRDQVSRHAASLQAGVRDVVNFRAFPLFNRMLLYVEWSAPVVIEHSRQLLKWRNLSRNRLTQDDQKSEPPRNLQDVFQGHNFPLPTLKPFGVPPSGGSSRILPN